MLNLEWAPNEHADDTSDGDSIDEWKPEVDDDELLACEWPSLASDEVVDDDGDDDDGITIVSIGFVCAERGADGFAEAPFVLGPLQYTVSWLDGCRKCVGGCRGLGCAAPPIASLGSVGRLAVKLDELKCDRFRVCIVNGWLAVNDAIDTDDWYECCGCELDVSGGGGVGISQ